MLGLAPAKAAQEATHEDLARAVGFAVGRTMVREWTKFCGNEPIRGLDIVCASERKGGGGHATSEGQNERATYEDVKQCILAANKSFKSSNHTRNKLHWDLLRVRVRKA